MGSASRKNNSFHERNHQNETEQKKKKQNFGKFPKQTSLMWFLGIFGRIKGNFVLLCHKMLEKRRRARR